MDRHPHFRLNLPQDSHSASKGETCIHTVELRPFTTDTPWGHPSTEQARLEPQFPLPIIPCLPGPASLSRYIDQGPEAACWVSWSRAKQRGKKKKSNSEALCMVGSSSLSSCVEVHETISFPEGNPENPSVYLSLLCGLPACSQ